MLKIPVALGLGVGMLIPATAVLADEGNWGDRDLPRPPIVIQTEPFNLGTVACDHSPSVEQFRVGHEQC